MLNESFLVLLVLLGVFFFPGCRSESQKPSPQETYESAVKLAISPLINPSEIECELKVGHIFALDKSRVSEKGEFDVLRAYDEAKDPAHPRPDAGSLSFTLTDLRSKKPKLKGYPYKKTEFDDLIVLTNDVGGAVVSFFIQKSTGGVIRTIGFIGEERPIGDVYAGRCRQVK